MSGLETKDWLGVSYSSVVKALHSLLAGLVESGLVAVSDVDESDAGGGLLINATAESGFVLNNHVWDVLSLTKLWKPHDKLNWVNIVGDDNEFGLTVLNEVGDVVETESEVLRGSLWSITTLGFGDQSLSLGLSGLWSVLVEKTEEMLG